MFNGWTLLCLAIMALIYLAEMAATTAERMNR